MPDYPDTIVITPEHVDPNKRQIHPNSLANLRPVHTKEHMKKMSKKSAEMRKRRRETREAIKEAVDLVNKINMDIVDEVPAALTVLKVAMMKAITENDMAEAAKLATQLAEYEQPKLQRTENVNTNFDFSDLTDDELAVEMQKLSNSGEKQHE